MTARALEMILTDPTWSFLPALIGVLVLAFVMYASEVQLSRRINDIVATVERDGFYTSKHVEVLPQGSPDVYAVHYLRRRDRSGWPRRAVVRGTDKLRRELALHLGG